MGYKITPEQQRRIRTTLDINEQGKVVFADFVQLIKEMFPFQMDNSRLETTLVMALTQKDSMDMPAVSKKVVNYLCC